MANLWDHLVWSDSGEDRRSWISGQVTAAVAVSSTRIRLGSCCHRYASAAAAGRPTVSLTCCPIRTLYCAMGMKVAGGSGPVAAWRRLPGLLI
jgi:hypothetical protein